MAESFNALVLEQSETGLNTALRRLREADLPPGDVTLQVEWSSLNYKDALVIDGNKGRLVRSFPHVPGIDCAGVVATSTDPRYRPGDSVICTGWRMGELHWGGYAQKARLSADWLTPLPPGLTARQAMAVGTAGLTAMLAVMELEKRGLTPQGAAGPVLVTGAAGGVGSVAVMLLASLGYTVTSVTGRTEQAPYLKSLGAAQVIPRADLATPSAKPLEAEQWSGCVDSVGGAMLGRLLGQMRYGATVAACGLAGGAELHATVLPFLLRGVALVGVDSVMQSLENRRMAWERIARNLPLDKLEAATATCALADLPARAREILAGQVRGRLIVDVNA